MSPARSPLFRFDERVAARRLKNAPGLCLVGIDEAGRGPWAGPVVAAAVVLSSDFFHPELNDSKKLAPRARAALYAAITASSFWAVGVADVPTVDRLNILAATHKAMRESLASLLARHPQISPGLVLVDGLPVPPFGFPQEHLVRGDSKSAAVAAAGIVAKVTRDRLMEEMDRLYPRYGFARHKGYGTREHLRNLLRLGPCAIHRRSFEPVRNAARAVFQ